MTGRTSVQRRAWLRRGVIAAGVGAVACFSMIGVSGAQTLRPAHAPASAWVQPNAIGGLDCNGMSPIQSLAQAAKACTDIRGIAGVHNKNVDDGRFYDNWAVYRARRARRAVPVVGEGLGQ